MKGLIGKIYSALRGGMSKIPIFFSILTKLMKFLDEINDDPIIPFDARKAAQNDRSTTQNTGTDVTDSRAPGAGNGRLQIPFRGRDEEE